VGPSSPQHSFGHPRCNKSQPRLNRRALPAVIAVPIEKGMFAAGGVKERAIRNQVVCALCRGFRVGGGEVGAAAPTRESGVLVATHGYRQGEGGSKLAVVTWLGCGSWFQGALVCALWKVVT
jgi:hypothetical protein